MNCKGHLAKVSQEKYGFRVDTRTEARTSVLLTLKTCSRQNLTLHTDEHRTYGPLIKGLLPDVQLQAFKSARADRKSGNRRNEDDNLFAVNLVAAKLRHDLSRMARRTWVTTKQVERLQAHLDLYIAFNNGYKL
jgi:IS1 family transposase